MATLFDAYIFVDWSAKNGPSPASPSPDAIWIGHRTNDGNVHETYVRTREGATEIVRGLLRDHVAAGRRVLVGFDFPYGYPAGFAACLATPEKPGWRAVWDFLGAHIVDTELNRSNRFSVASRANQMVGDGPGPFWGCSPSHGDDQFLTRRRVGVFDYPFAGRFGPVARLRATEAAMPGVQETWKLLGAGSVGSQALLGIPRVRDLRDDSALGPISRVWPFETGFTSNPSRESGPYVLHAEIWPGIVDPVKLADLVAQGLIKDQAQVRLMCEWAACADSEGTLGRWFSRDVLPDGVDVDAVAGEEGWILGCAAENSTA